jgi:hypothetical protein
VDHCSVGFESRWFALDDAKAVLADFTNKSYSINSSLKEVLAHKQLTNINHEQVFL